MSQIPPFSSCQKALVETSDVFNGEEEKGWYFWGEKQVKLTSNTCVCPTIITTSHKRSAPVIDSSLGVIQWYFWLHERTSMIWAEGWLGINGAVEVNSLKWSSKNFYLPPRCSPHPPQLKWPKQAVHRRRSPKGVLNWRVSISFPQCPLLSQSQLPHTKCTVKWERHSVTMHVVTNLPLTTKQKFRFCMSPMY